MLEEALLEILSHSLPSGLRSDWEGQPDICMSDDSAQMDMDTVVWPKNTVLKLALAPSFTSCSYSPTVKTCLPLSKLFHHPLVLKHGVKSVSLWGSIHGFCRVSGIFRTHSGQIVPESGALYGRGLQPFWHCGQFHGRRFFQGLGGMIQACYVYCPLYFYHYYIISTLDHQALDPRGWGPLLYIVKENWPSVDNDWCPVLCLYCFELTF